MDSPQWFVADEAFQAFDAEGEFAGGEGALGREAAGAQACQVVGEVVFRAVDDAEVFAAACRSWPSKKFPRDPVRSPRLL